MTSPALQELIKEFKRAHAVFVRVIVKREKADIDPLDGVELVHHQLEKSLEAIASFPAQSLEDLVAKAHMANWVDDGSIEEQIAHSLVHDLLRLGEGAAIRFLPD